jgi:hypothetical protein
VQTDIYSRQKRYARKIQAAVADVGDIPAVKNAQRRESCRLDLLRFLTTYFPLSTGLKPFSEDHVKVIARIQQATLEGGLFLQALPRGFAKTTISENSAIWATLYGHRSFVPIFGADAAASAGNIDSIKLELAENDLLLDDFPEVCYPIRALENKPQRCASQTHTIWAPCGECGGTGKLTVHEETGEAREIRCGYCQDGQIGDAQHTYVQWTADTIVLPTIRGSVASGAIITARGIMAGCRGMKHKRADGTQQRPDFVILDDPQTDESAATPLQVEKRLNVIRKSILKLGGHARKIAAVMNATVIRPGDLIEQILNPKKFPAWQGERVKMVRKWSEAHETLWLTDYAERRNTYDPDVLGDQQRAHREATEFYRLNRDKMDAGCEVSWEHCYDEAVELSAIQHAYNSLIDDGAEVFAAECQNEPLEEKVEDDDLRLRPEDVTNKLNRTPRGTLPIEVSRVVAFIDPKKDMLFWTAAGFADGFGGAVVDYGVFPDQKRPYFSARAPHHPLAKVVNGDTWEAILYAGLDTLVNSLAGREWVRSDGAKFKIERILIDHGWGDAAETIDLFCRQSPQAAILLPSKGYGVTARSGGFNERKQKAGERRGQSWRIPAATAKGTARQVVFDSNWWKTFTAARIKTQMGGRGCLTIFGDKPDPHRLFADHACSEIPAAVESKGRRVIEWGQQVGIDNDYFDCLVGCHVAASIQGVTLHDRQRPVYRKTSLADLKKHAQHWDAKKKEWVKRG